MENTDSIKRPENLLSVVQTGCTSSGRVEIEPANFHQISLEIPGDYFLQNAGVNTISRVKSSSRPSNIAKLHTQV